MSMQPAIGLLFLVTMLGLLVPAARADIPMYRDFPVYPPGAQPEPGNEPNRVDLPAAPKATTEGVEYVTKRAAARGWTRLSLELKQGAGRSAWMVFARRKQDIELVHVKLSDVFELRKTVDGKVVKAGAIGRSSYVFQVVPPPELHDGFPICVHFAAPPEIELQDGRTVVSAECRPTDDDRFLPAEIPMLFGWRKDPGSRPSQFSRKGIQVRKEETGKLWTRRYVFTRQR